MAQYSEALEFCRKGLDIIEKTKQLNYPRLTIAYKHMASLYIDIKEYANALYFNEKELDSLEKKSL